MDSGSPQPRRPKGRTVHPSNSPSNIGTELEKHADPQRPQRNRSASGSSRSKRHAIRPSSNPRRIATRYFGFFPPPNIGSASLLLEPPVNETIAAVALVPPLCCERDAASQMETKLVVACTGGLHMFEAPSAEVGDGLVNSETGGPCEMVQANRRQGVLTRAWMRREFRNTEPVRRAYLLSSVQPSCLVGPAMAQVPPTLLRHFAFAATEKSQSTHIVGVGSTGAHFTTTHSLHRDRRVIALALSVDAHHDEARERSITSANHIATPTFSSRVVSIDEEGCVAVMDVQSGSAALVRFSQESQPLLDDDGVGDDGGIRCSSCSSEPLNDRPQEDAAMQDRIRSCSTNTEAGSSPLLRFVGHGCIRTVKVLLEAPCAAHCPHCHHATDVSNALSVQISLSVADNSALGNGEQFYVLRMKLTCHLRAVVPYVECDKGVEVVFSQCLATNERVAGEDGMGSSTSQTLAMYDGTSPLGLKPRWLPSGRGMALLPRSAFGGPTEEVALRAFAFSAAKFRLCGVFPCSGEALNRSITAQSSAHGPFAAAGDADCSAMWWSDLMYTGPRTLCHSDADASLAHWRDTLLAITCDGFLLLLGIDESSDAVKSSRQARQPPAGTSFPASWEKTPPSDTAHVARGDFMSYEERQALESWLDDIDTPTDASWEQAPRGSPRTRQQGAVEPHVTTPQQSAKLKPLASTSVHASILSVLAELPQSGTSYTILGADTSVAYVVDDSSGDVMACPMPVRVEGTRRPACHTMSRPMVDPSILDWRPAKASGAPGSLMRLLTSAVENVPIPVLPKTSSVTKVLASLFMGDPPAPLLTHKMTADPAIDAVSHNEHGHHRPASVRSGSARSTSRSSVRRSKRVIVVADVDASKPAESTAQSNQAETSDGGLVLHTTNITEGAARDDARLLSEHRQFMAWERLCAAIDHVPQYEEPDARMAIVNEHDSHWVRLLVQHEDAVGRIAQTQRLHEQVQKAAALSAHLGAATAQAITLDDALGWEPAFEWQQLPHALHHATTSAQFTSKWRKRVHTVADDQPVISRSHQPQPLGLGLSTRTSWIADFLRSGIVPQWLLERQDQDRCELEVRDLELSHTAELVRLEELLHDEVVVLENQKMDRTTGQWVPLNKCPFQDRSGLAVDVAAVLQVCDARHVVHSSIRRSCGWRWLTSPDSSGVISSTELSADCWTAGEWKYAAYWPTVEPGDDEHWCCTKDDGMVRRRARWRVRVSLDVLRELEALRAKQSEEMAALRRDLGLP